MNRHFRIQSGLKHESSSSNNVSLSRVRNRKINLISHSKGKWNPFQGPTKCIICWKPIEIDDFATMECPHCHSKAHQDHMLQWLSKRKFCPYCKAKW